MGPSEPLVGRRIAIHAGRQWDRKEIDACVRRLREANMDVPMDELAVRGAIFATVKIVGGYRIDQVIDDAIFIGQCVPGSAVATRLPLSDLERTLGDFVRGIWVWRLADVQRVGPPLPIRGHQRIWYAAAFCGPAGGLVRTFASDKAGPVFLLPGWLA